MRPPPGREHVLELLANRALDRGAVDSEPACRCQAVLAEAEPEEEPRAVAELDEVALVVVAVLEPVVVQRLGEDRGHLVAADIRDERAHVGADVRVCGAEVGRVAVAERVLGVAVRVVARPVEMEEHGPGVDPHPSLLCGTAGLGEHVALACGAS